LTCKSYTLKLDLNLSWCCVFGSLFKNGCLASNARQAGGKKSGIGGQLPHRCTAVAVHRLALWAGQLSTAGGNWDARVACSASSTPYAKAAERAHPNRLTTIQNDWSGASDAAVGGAARRSGNKGRFCQGRTLAQALSATNRVNATQARHCRIKMVIRLTAIALRSGTVTGFVRLQ
jgi:hypothetical protein